MFNHREIWWCSVGVNVGVEQDGKNQLYERPVLIIRKFNQSLFLGVPLSTKLKDYPFRHNLYYRNNGKLIEGQAILPQMRSYDAKRLSRVIARLGTKQYDSLMDEVAKMLNFK